jgi:hypothetical protein
LPHIVDNRTMTPGSYVNLNGAWYNQRSIGRTFGLARPLDAGSRRCDHAGNAASVRQTGIPL